MLNSEKKTGTKLSRPVLLILFLAVLIIAGSIWISRLTETNQYFKAIQAAHRGKWPEAFLSFRALQQRSPGYRDVKARLEEAARNAITECAGRLDLQIEVEIIRWIANAKDYELLAESLDDCMVSIPEGKFILGSDHGKPDERPSRQITVDSFFLDRYEVTLAQYQRFLLDTDFKSPAYWVDTLTPPGRLDLPVVGVSWIQANTYCEWAGKRLPTEAEWEKACRGVSGNEYPWGDNWASQNANVGIHSTQLWPEQLDDAWEYLRLDNRHGENPGLEPIGSYPSGISPFGVLDLCGNVSEWVADWYNWDGYWTLPSNNPVTLGPPWNHGIRGSSWIDLRGQEVLISESSRCAARSSSHSFDDPRVGFRCARSD